MRIYLDNCCYNRPYDDQTQLRISLETQAKLQIQTMIRDKRFELVTSYVLLYENSRNPHETRKNTILSFIKENNAYYVDIEKGRRLNLSQMKSFLRALRRLTPIMLPVQLSVAQSIS